MAKHGKQMVDIIMVWWWKKKKQSDEMEPERIDEAPDEDSRKKQDNRDVRMTSEGHSKDPHRKDPHGGARSLSKAIGCNGDTDEDP